MRLDLYQPNERHCTDVHDLRVIYKYTPPLTSHGGLVMFAEAVVGVTMHKGGLAHRTVTDHKHLEQVVLGHDGLGSERQRLRLNEGGRH